MRKLLKITAAIVFLASSYLISFTLTKEGNTEKKNYESITAFTEQDKYLVKEYEEKIGIFKSGSADPDVKLDVFVFTLPDADKTLLNNGFEISSGEIENVIEDYTG